ncbi:MAG: hypothetical protein HZA53_04640 [Planctomycetes bacterium]|nr:hypothetical protein [Planctomycetota bacterium]
MTAHMENHPPDPLERTRLLRAAADGELTPAERRDYEIHLARHPEDARVVEFEQQLRSRLGTALTVGEKPPELEDRVRRIADASRPGRARRFVPYLVAAGILAVAAVGLLLALRRNVDDFGFQGRGKLVDFLGAHAKECPITIQRTIEEFNVHRLGEAVTDIEARLGSAPVLGDLDSVGLSFRGMGLCGIPGHGVSLHLQFMGQQGSRLEGTMLSVYVQGDDGRMPLVDGVTYRLQPKTEELASVQMYVWRRAGIDYFVVTPHVEAGLAVLASAGVAPPTQML